MLNAIINESSGQVFCGNRTCGHELGFLANHSFFVTLESYRCCVLKYVSSVCEHTTDNFTSVVVNRLVELDGTDARADTPIEPEVILEEDLENVDDELSSNVSMVAEVGSEGNFLSEDNQSVITGEDVNLGANMDTFERSGTSEASSDILERLVNEILGEEDGFDAFLEGMEFNAFDEFMSESMPSY